MDVQFFPPQVNRHLEQNPLHKAGNHGKERLFTLEDNGGLKNVGNEKVEDPSLEGTTIEFAHVPGPASYASINRLHEKPNAGRQIYLTTFTSRSAGETLLIDWGVTDRALKSAFSHFERK